MGGDRRAQSATEFMLLITTLLIIIIPLLFIIVDYGSKSVLETDVTRVNEIGKNMAVQAREIFFLGMLTKEKIAVTMPNGLQGIGIITLMDTSGTTDAVETYINITYMAGDEEHSVMSQSEVLLKTGACDTTLSASKCPLGTPAGIECYTCGLPKIAHTQGRKEFQLETVKDAVHDKFMVQITLR